MLSGEKVWSFVVAQSRSTTVRLNFSFVVFRTPRGKQRETHKDLLVRSAANHKGAGSPCSHCTFLYTLARNHSHGGKNRPRNSCSPTQFSKGPVHTHLPTKYKSFSQKGLVPPFPISKHIDTHTARYLKLKCRMCSWLWRFVLCP